MIKDSGQGLKRRVRALQGAQARIMNIVDNKGNEIVTAGISIPGNCWILYSMS
jgi:hypothetical protein